MMITGKIKNVVDFGAFVDLGLKETALVHISEMSDHFVKNPLETVKVGDVLEFRIISLDTERRRISLSRKKDDQKAGSKEQRAEGKQQRTEQRSASKGQTAEGNVGKYGVVSKRPVREQQSPVAQKVFEKDNDGTMYNPFAEAFKKKK
jgi:uncharacterized protein